MWLLKFHIAFSLLCQLSFIGVVVAFKDRLRRFQTEPKGKKKKYLYWLMFFCPGINVIFTIVVWIMAFCDDTTVELITSQWDK